MRISKRRFLTAVPLGVLLLSGCRSEPGEGPNAESKKTAITPPDETADPELDEITPSESETGANLALTNSTDESARITVIVTDTESGDPLLRDSYRVAASDDGALVEGVVTTTGRYEVEATVEDTDESASGIWRIPSDADPAYYSIRIGLLSDGTLSISGEGIR